MMSELRSGVRPRGWKAWVCGVAIVGTSLGGVAAGAARPTVPGAPTITSVTAEDHSIKVAFTKPASNGGSPIFNYKATCISSDGGVTRSAGDFRSPVLVEGLSARHTYTCTVMAENRAGFGPPSAPSAAVVVLPLLPGAPTITSVTAKDHSIKLVFTKPASNGGSPIFNYKATCSSSNGGVTRSAGEPRTAFDVDGLTAGDTYTCTVMAENRAGFGPPSAPSAAVVVLPVLPGAPTITSATAADHSIKLVFTKPASNGGSPIFNYKATCSSSNGGVTRSAGEPRTAFDVDGLTAGKTYTCTVMAKNSAGFGPPSAPSAPVVVLPILPGAPTITSVTAGLESVQVAFSPPAPNGAGNIFDYNATCISSNGGVTRSKNENASPILVTNLTAGSTYTCTVLAEDSAGFGPPSAPSAPVVTLGPPTAPGAPTITSVTAGSKSISVAFSPPASDGGATIVDYRATCVSSDGGVTRTNDAGTSPILVTHLSAANTYTCTVMAKNSVGFGPPSAPSAPVVTLS
jgi:hypothetical protein